MILKQEPIEVSFSGQSIFKLPEEFLNVPLEEVMVVVSGQAATSSDYEIRDKKLYWKNLAVQIATSTNLIIAAYFDEPEEAEKRKRKSRK